MFKKSKIWQYKVVNQANNQEFDLGFLGVKSYLPNAKIPHKKSKNKPLTDDQKKYNKLLSQTRVKIENINREIKIFRVCKETRRQKQKKHNLFWNLVAGIVNLKLRS